MMLLNQKVLYTECELCPEALDDRNAKEIITMYPMASCVSKVTVDDWTPEKAIKALVRNKVECRVIQK